MTTKALPALTRTTVQCCSLALVLACACSRGDRAHKATQGPVGSATTSAPKPPRLSCTTGLTTFSLGPVEEERHVAHESAGELGDNAVDTPGAGEAKQDGDSDSPEDLPFGVNVGMALAHAGGYVVSAIDTRDGNDHAVLALLDTEVARGRILDLGRVYGDAEPPRMILRGDALFVVVPDTDASGNSYRYGWVRGLETANRIDWLGSFETTVDDSDVFSVDATNDTITIAWDEVDGKNHRSHVRWASLDARGQVMAGAPTRPGSKRDPKASWVINTTSEAIDAEAPQLVMHQAGYWLAYLSAEVSDSKNEAPNRASRAPGASNTSNESANDDSSRAVELGRRGITLTALDRYGRTQGKPIVVTGPNAHVVTFDIEATRDGGATVAYRDEDANPGAESRVVEVARVRPDGGVEHHRIEDEHIGAGMPMLLPDSEIPGSDGSDSSTWLSVAGTTGETRLAALAEAGPPSIDLTEAPKLVGVEPLLRRGKSLLVVRHRARYVEFERIQCKWSNGPPTPTSVRQ